jgi:hypothetical protein
MKTLLGLITLASLSNYAVAAVPTNISEDVKQHLRLAPEKRSTSLRPMGIAGKRALAEIAFDAKESLDLRWKAIVTLGRLDPVFARPHLETAMKSTDWFMRNAALVVVPYNERGWAIKWSRILMHDQALVVRTAAVKALTELRAIEATDLLWEKLYASENFKRGTSLWIRPYIAKALAGMARKQDQPQYLKMLQDKDSRLHVPAQLALNKITGLEKSREEWITTAVTTSPGHKPPSKTALK